MPIVATTIVGREDTAQNSKMLLQYIRTPCIQAENAAGGTDVRRLENASVRQSPLELVGSRIVHWWSTYIQVSTGSTRVGYDHHAKQARGACFQILDVCVVT